MDIAALHKLGGEGDCKEKVRNHRKRMYLVLTFFTTTIKQNVICICSIGVSAYIGGLL